MEIINNNCALPPDWADTSDGKTVARPMSSDRLYYIDDNCDGQIDDINGSKGMSFNHYYDAVRTGWRLALDYSWNGDNRALPCLNKLMDFFAPKYGDSSEFVDGYDVNGGPWNRANRDLFNNFLPSQNGGQNRSTTFVAMEACAFMAGVRSTAYFVYENARLTGDDVAGKFHYYGNTTRLLSLVYLGGYMIDLYNY
jgi:hypothetical protein